VSPAGGDPAGPGGVNVRSPLAPLGGCSRQSLAHTRSGHSHGVPVKGKKVKRTRRALRYERDEIGAPASAVGKSEVYENSRWPGNGWAARETRDLRRRPGPTADEPDTADGAPGRGRRRLIASDRATKRAPSLPGSCRRRATSRCRRRGLPATARLPRLVARGYLAAVPGHMPSVPPFYGGSRPLGRAASASIKDLDRSSASHALSWAFISWRRPRFGSYRTGVRPAAGPALAVGPPGRGTRRAPLPQVGHAWPTVPRATPEIRAASRRRRAGPAGAGR
jgi:hypothetical protein